MTKAGINLPFVVHFLVCKEEKRKMANNDYNEMNEVFGFYAEDDGWDPSTDDVAESFCDAEEEQEATPFDEAETAEEAVSEDEGTEPVGDDDPFDDEAEAEAEIETVSESDGAEAEAEAVNPSEEKAEEKSCEASAPEIEAKTEPAAEAEEAETKEAAAEEKAESKEKAKSEEKSEAKAEEKEEPMPEFTGTVSERAIQKLDWEFAHMGDKGKDKPKKSVYDSLLAEIKPQDRDRVLCYLKEEAAKDETLAEKILLPHKSFKRCMKVFIETFTRYFNAYGITNLPTVNVDGRSCPVGTCPDEMGFRVIKGYYFIDDEAQVKKEEKEEKEKAKKEKENKKAKTSAVTKPSTSTSTAKKDEKKPAEKKKTAAEKKKEEEEEAQLCLFPDLG